jgi:hypothetical protein
MFQVGRYTFKRAETTSELEQVYALNYATFVREIPQHDDHGGGRLVDKFDSRNVYFIALRDARIVGMVSAHDQPPFSVAGRMSDASALEAPGARPLEIRLLAIEPQERFGIVIGGLFWALYRHVRQGAYTHVYISGLEERLKLYSGLGFEALGPAVLSGQARYVPMSMSAARIEKYNDRIVRLWEGRLARQSRGSK